MKRRITITLDVGMESECEFSLSEMAESLAEDIEMMLPSVCVPRRGVPAKDWPCATLTRVAVSRVTEQEEAAA